MNARAGDGRGIWVYGVVGVMVLGLLWIFAGGSERALQRGATGFDGLVHWLKSTGTDARRFTGGGVLVRGSVGLRILPLFDTDLTKDIRSPADRTGVIAQTSETDIARSELEIKRRDLPTLIILPKWRKGMRLLEVAHRDLLIPRREINRLAAQLGLTGARVRRDPGGYREQTGPSGERFGLMHGQTLERTGCTPLIGSATSMLLGRCPLPKTDDVGAQRHYWLLADPDLMNNHGLALANNAGIAATLVVDTIRASEDADADATETRPVLVDLTTTDHTVEEDWMQEQRERTWNDFARMFRWPFAMIWIAFAALAALVLWQAAVRAGPLARLDDDAPGASKAVSIAAKARLLRLSDHDGALLAAHVKARLTHLASEVLGPHRPPDQPAAAALQARIGRQDPELAKALAEAADIPKDLPAPDIIPRLDHFEALYDKVIHDFGRTSGPR